MEGVKHFQPQIHLRLFRRTGNLLLTEFGKYLSFSRARAKNSGVGVRKTDVGEPPFKRHSEMLPGQQLPTPFLSGQLQFDYE